MVSPAPAPAQCERAVVSHQSSPPPLFSSSSSTLPLQISSPGPASNLVFPSTASSSLSSGPCRAAAVAAVLASTPSPNPAPLFDSDSVFVQRVFDDVCQLSPSSASDIFPLPKLPRPQPPSSLSRRVQNRHSSSCLHVIVFNSLVSSLNTMYFSFHALRSSSSPHPSPPSVGNLVVKRVCSFLHSSVHSFLRRRGVLPISGVASAPDDFLPTSVFESYISSQSLPVVPLVASKISLPSSPAPVPLLSILPDKVASAYSSPSLVSSFPPPLTQSQRSVKPALCDPGEWSAFVRRLVQHGMVDFMKEPAVVNPVFCVSKSDDQLRFLINAINANSFFPEPVNPRLPTPDMVASLLPSLSSRGPLFAAKVDLECFYFFISLPSWLVPFFGMPSVRAADVSSDLAAKYGSDTLLFPCFNRLPMGWSHSVFLAQEAHLHILLSRGVLRDVDRICRENDLRLDRVRWFIYIDDFCIIGFDPVVVRHLQDAYLSAIRSLGFVAKPSKLVLPTSAPVSLLGLEFDGAALSYGLGIAKIDALCKDTRRFVSSFESSGHRLAALVGRWSWAMMVRRPLFSLLSSVFTFIQRAGSSVFRIWPSVRRELVALLGLTPLLHVVISPSVFPVAVAVDASSSAAGVVAVRSSSAALAPLAATVSARFDLPERTASSTASCVPLSSLSPSFLHLSDAVRGVLSSESVSRVVASFPWAVSEHINSLELRAALCGIRKLLSSPAALSSRCVLFTDSAVSFFALRKGRCSSHELLRRVRPISALSLAAGLRLCPVWLPSALNPADAPSRLWSLSSKQRNRLVHSLNGNTSFVHVLAAAGSPSTALSPLLCSSLLPRETSSSFVPLGSFLSAPLPAPLRVKNALQPIPLPPLRQASVAPSTLANYSNQLSYFLVWLAQNEIRPLSSRDVDFAFESFLHSFLAARGGRGLALARNAFFGLLLFYPQLRASMQLSRRALLGWEKMHPSVSHPPLSWDLTLLLALKFVLASRDLVVGISMAVGVLVAWDAYLRVGELCGLRVGDVLFKDVGTVFKTSIPAYTTRSSSTALKRLKAFSTLPVIVSLFLPATKTGPNQWAQIRSPLVASVLHSYLSLRAACGLSMDPLANIFLFSTASFRAALADMCAAFGLSSSFTPHSLRHGHATSDYEAGATVQDIAVRGRWRTLDSLLIYVQSGPALSVKYRPSPEVASLASAVASDFSRVFAAAIRKRLSLRR